MDISTANDSDDTPLARQQTEVQPAPTEASKRKLRRSGSRPKKPTDVSAAGEAFRRQLATKKLPATDEALDASKATARDEVLFRGDSDDSSACEKAARASQDFIASDSSTDNGKGCLDEAGPHPGARFRFGSLSGSEEEMPRQQARSAPHQYAHKRRRVGEGFGGPLVAASRFKPSSKSRPTSHAADMSSDLSDSNRAALNTLQAAAVCRKVILSDSSSDDEASTGVATKREEWAAEGRHSFATASAHGRQPRTTPEPRQRTVTAFFQPRQQPAATTATELEDSDAEEPQPITLDDDETGSLDDFIASDDEDGGGGDSESGEDDEEEYDPVPASLQRLRNRLGADTLLNNSFAEFCCGLLHDIMGISMDRALMRLSDEGRWAIRDALETGCHEVSGNLGWVNAQRNGVIDAMRSLTHCTTAHNVGDGSVDDTMDGGYDDEEEEDLRDGRFVCDICGRADPVKSVTLKGTCKSSIVPTRSTGSGRGGGAGSRAGGFGGGRIALHSAPPTKSCHTERRRPSSPEGGSEDEAADGDDDSGGGDVGASERGSRCRRRRQQSLHEIYGGRAPRRKPREEERTFFVGPGCVRRLMLAQLLWHWTCLFADKLRALALDPSRVAQIAARGGGPKAAVAHQLDGCQNLIRFWHGRLRSVLGLAKKVQTKVPRKHALQSVGPEVQKYYREFDKQFTDDR